MSNLLAARAQMGTSLAFHIIFASLGIVLSGPHSFIAIELGWMVTELGRQPWVIYNILRTSDAVTTAPGLDISFAIFSGIYVVLAITLTLLLLRLARSPLPKQEWPVLASSSNEERVDTKCS